MSKNCRRAPRIPVEARVVVYSGNQRLTCRLLNVSESGMALAADTEQPSGTFLRLRLTLPGDKRPTGVDAVVVRHRASGSKVEWGVQLVDPPPELLSRIRQLEADELGVVILPGYESPRPAETRIKPQTEGDEDPLVQRLLDLHEKIRHEIDD